MNVGDLVKYSPEAVNCGCVLLINVDRIGLIIAVRHLAKEWSPVCTIKFFGTGAVTHSLNARWLEKIE